MQDFLSKMDEMGKPAWLTLMILGFVIFWPVGLAALFFLIFSGRFSDWRYERHLLAGGPSGNSHARETCHPRRYRGGCGGRPRGHRRKRHAPSSGNSAFDDYREEVLRRLEEEQSEFQDYLNRLRQAKDKEEFEAFVAERKSKGAVVPDPGSPEPETDPDEQGPSENG
ncbi:MAG: DUF2852 domain-containing protein [Alphaproteobacteria bacterium]|nr:MAG: DUF2852 domain-containing protein [Alphaproteobacteria bacterium]